MKKKMMFMMAVSLILTICLTAALVGCSCNNGIDENKPDPNTPALSVQKIADFKDGESDLFTKRTGENGSPFDVVWKEDNVTFEDGNMKLTITESENGYSSGEYRSHQFFGYGDYSVKMKPVKEVGVATTFFTYTDDYDKNADGVGNPHDEIDIEFLGKDTTKVQFNYFVNGEGGHEYMYDLGFDASEAFHEYGFRWSEDSIIWFVDGKPVYQVKGDKLPKTPGRIMMNHWCGDEKAYGWMGEYQGPVGNSAQYEYVGTTATGIGVIPEKPDVPSGDVDWDTIDPVSLTFASTNGKHTIDPAAGGETAHVTYSGITNDYSNVYADAVGPAAGKNAFRVKVKNNGTTTPIIRVDVIDAAGKALNTYAMKDGAVVNTDLVWGGSYYNDIPAGEEFEAVIYFEGAASKVLFMLDSTRAGDTKEYSGDLTFSEFKFGKVVEEKTALAFNTDAAYTIDPSGTAAESVNVTYTDIKDASYVCINSDITAAVGSNNNFKMKVTNNGEKIVNFRVDVGYTENNALKSQITKAVGGVVNQDKGADYSVNAGESVTVNVTFDTAAAITGMNVFIDSSIWKDEGQRESHAGDVTLGDFTFETVQVVDPGQSVALEFATSEATYSLTPSADKKSLTVVYTNTINNWQNVSAPIADVAASKTVFTMKVKNNGTEKSGIRIDILNTAGEKLNASATVDGVDAPSSDGTVFEVAAGAEVEVIVNYTGTANQLLFFLDSHHYEEPAVTKYSGNVTFSEFAFA